MTRLWLTRPATDSARMAESLRARGIDSITAPLLRIAPSRFHIGRDRPTALLITSRHTGIALMSLPADWRGLPVYCVGQATARMARHHGFMNVVVGQGSALTLVPRLLATRRTGDRILHLCGEDVRVNLAPLLARYGIALDRTVVYRAVPGDRLAPPVLEALREKHLGGVVFYSPRSVRIAYDLLEQADALTLMQPLDLYCLSLEIATEASQFNARRLHVAKQPTHQAMMELLFATAITTP